jgi:hypothetical protein
MAAELVFFEELVPALGKFSFVLVLDCQEHSGTRTAVRSVAALLRIDLLQ